MEVARSTVQMRLSGSMEAEIYPGAPRYVDGISYWVPDREAGQKVVAKED
jgi:polyisoprenyl-teichoic acid--peptidoglycan teichoic acid transferase